MFIQFRLCHVKGSNSIKCPCLKCRNRLLKDVLIVRYHLYANGIDQSYKVWLWRMENTVDENYEYVDLLNIMNMVQSVNQLFLQLSEDFEVLKDFEGLKGTKF